MSQLELLKIQLDTMDKKIKEIYTNIENKKVLIITIQHTKKEIDQQLIDEQLAHDKLVQNYTYLCEVKQDTSSNYNQIEEAANTLLDIIKSKCDSIS